MPLEDDAKSFRQQLAYSLGEASVPLNTSLQAIGQMLGHMAAFAEQSADQPGRFALAVKHAYGSQAHDALCHLVRCTPAPTSQMHYPNDRDALYDLLDPVCGAFGQDVSHWAEVMGFFFRDLVEVAHGHEQSQSHIERMLHLSLGLEAAYCWHRICRAAIQRT
ncbi:MAG: hypothetical protein EPO09_20040 [Aquabacterium sp.]|uniref:hypothetical protein n=1 Tax=Aquabacterium sp. TaxID=1872578 RepID=UPI001209070F|nr:hypothetical protein [Aquabacterium sp.]TAK85765.1 MAG: hypothetical protein EPO09_20040 [Aquabacterium sp.]